MLHIVDQSKAGPSDALLRAMFEARKRVFIDLLGWDLPVLAGKYELDQFDTPDAIYLILAGVDRAHRASARLLPTTRPHLLDTLFRGLCDGAVPRGERIWEITRFCLDRSLDAQARRRARDELVHGLARLAYAHGIERYTGVAEAGWLAQILDFGWRADTLGEPQTIGGKRLGALAIDIDAGTTAQLERRGIRGGAPFAGEFVHAA